MRAARVFNPHAMTSHIAPRDGGTRAGLDRDWIEHALFSSWPGFSSDVATAMSHARSAATALPTPASHSSAPTRSRTTLDTPLRPGASTCAAHRGAFGSHGVRDRGRVAAARRARAPCGRAHRRTAARRGGEGWERHTGGQDRLRGRRRTSKGTASPIHRGGGARPAAISVTAASAEPSSSSAMLP